MLLHYKNCLYHKSCIYNLRQCKGKHSRQSKKLSYLERDFVNVMLRPPRALPCFSRPLNIKRCLPEAPASNDVYLTRHQAWITCQNLPGSPSAFLCGVKGHTWNYCAEEGEPGDEASFYSAWDSTALVLYVLLRVEQIRKSHDTCSS